MSYRDTAYQLIKYFEGEELEAYYCPAGVLTIGIGVTKSFYPQLTPESRITVLESKELFNRVLDHFEDKCTAIPDWQNKTNTQKAALISFAYNTGFDYPDRENFATLCKALESRSPKKITEALMLYCNADGKPLLGLYRRRFAESLLYWGKDVNYVLRIVEKIDSVDHLYV
jgi:GH24 family phage-related lysozyme (muramidase)